MSTIPRHSEERLTQIQDGLASVFSMDSLCISKQDVRSLLFEVRDLRTITAELLAALELFVCIRDWRHDKSHDARREYDKAADEARGVIAKAKGEAI